MRLIDADALENKVLKWMPTDPCGIEEKEYPFETDIVVSLMMEIEEAPTIKPKCGKWIETYISVCFGEMVMYKCDQCGVVVGFKTNFCPNCGARMKELNDE